MRTQITYFDEEGKQNTQETLALAKQRARELGIRTVVLASSHGYTALEAARVFAGTGVALIAVTISVGFRELGWCMSADERAAVEKAGVTVLTSQLSFGGGVEEAFGGDSSPQSIIAHTFYCFSQGMKVAAEITVMAAEAGLIGTDEDVIALAGSSEGADTAIVLKPACAKQFKQLRIKEILCKPIIGS